MNRRKLVEQATIDSSNHPMSTAVSWDTPPGVRKFMGERWEYTHLHIKPQSILITPIGNLWSEGAWWRLQDMMLATTMAGYSVSLHEVRDASLFSFEAIPMMRWSASMLARDGGLEWCLMVDNDALLEKDTLLKLLSHDRPVVFPLLEDLEKRFPDEIARLSDPVFTPGQGLKPARWAAMSVMLFNTKIFNVLTETAWRGTDYLFSQALNFLGHRIYVDTDAVVGVAKGPARHPMKGYHEYWKDHKEMQKALRYDKRDRRPPPGFNPDTDNGWLDPAGTYFAIQNGYKEE